VLAGDQAAPGGGTLARTGVGLGEPHPLAIQPVEVRRFDVLLPIASQVVVAEIIGEDEEDVRSALFSSSGVK
jgi:hypothetical protein